MLFKLGRFLAAALLEISVGEAILIALLYAVTSYAGLALAGEQALIENGVNYIYWLIVTASTVGYGDLSPTTALGKAITGFYIIPVGLSLFALLITKFTYFLTHTISRRHKGLAMVRDKNHCVIIGWNETRTPRLIELLTSKSNGLKEHVVLCSEVVNENPLPEDIEFIKVTSYLNELEVQRCNLSHANRILIDLTSDDATLTTALLCEKLNPDAHKTAYFKDENIGRLLKIHCPDIEIIPSISIELLARATLDPGSSSIHRQLLDSTDGVNQFSGAYQGEDIPFEVLFTYYKNQLNATLIGFRRPGAADITLNPSLADRVVQGATLYYYASNRITHHPTPSV